MGRLNTLGDFAIGTTQISVNGAVPAGITDFTAGAPSWYTDTVLFFQAQVSPGAYRMRFYDTGSGIETDADPDGQNGSGAGGSTWWAWLAGGPRRGVRSSAPGFTVPIPNGRGLFWVQTDGTAVLTSYPANSGLFVYAADGALQRSYAATIVRPDVRLTDDLLTYCTPAGWFCSNVATGGGIPYAQLAAMAIFSAAVAPGGTPWVVEYRGDLGLFVRQPALDQAYVLPSTVDQFFHPDVLALSGTVIRIAGTITEGEAPTDVRMIDLDLVSGATTLWRSISPAGTLTSSVGPVLSPTTIPLSGSINTAVSGGSGGSGDTPTGNAIRRIRRPPLLATAQTQPRIYPHVDQVTDLHAKQSLRLLWDQHADLLSTVQAQQQTLTAIQSQVTAVTASAASAQQTANDAVAIAGKPVSSDAAASATVLGGGVGGGGVGGGIGGGGGSPGGGGGGTGSDDPSDGGAAGSGCALGNPTGHVDAGSPLTAYVAGSIICGTCREFPALLAAAPDQATRDANQAELLGRVIWHLQNAGFTAGKQQNPSGAISGDKVTVQVQDPTGAGGTLFLAYDFLSGPPFSEPLNYHCNQVSPAHYVPDGGIPD